MIFAKKTLFFGKLSSVSMKEEVIFRSTSFSKSGYSSKTDIKNLHSSFYLFSITVLEL